LLLNGIAAVINHHEFEEINGFSSEWNNVVIDSVFSVSEEEALLCIGEAPVPSIISDLDDLALISVFIVGVNTGKNSGLSLLDINTESVLADLHASSPNGHEWLLHPLSHAGIWDNISILLVESLDPSSPEGTHEHSSLNGTSNFFLGNFDALLCWLIISEDK